MTAATATQETVADLLEQLGDISPARVLMHPLPGTATEADLVALLEAPDKRLYELVDGVLVEKAMGFKEGILGGAVVHFLWKYLEDNDLGVPSGADGPVRLRLGLVRLPDACFVSWKRLPDDKALEEAIAPVVPNLAVEVISRGNTPKEISRKVREYFQAGVELVWILYPKTQIAEVYTSPSKKRIVDKDGALEGGKVLPGFHLQLKTLFARAGRRKGGK